MSKNIILEGICQIWLEKALRIVSSQEANGGLYLFLFRRNRLGLTDGQTDGHSAPLDSLSLEKA
jgi:hypothetical protein